MNIFDLSNCVDSFDFKGNNYQFNHCSSIISAEYNDNTLFNEKSLINLSKECFEAYKYRLEDISEVMFNVGKNEFQLINKQIINTILPFDPLKFSFSITNDPSLHFFIRFPKGISLFVETFLDLEEGHDTYIQIYKSKDILVKLNCFFDDGVSEIDSFLKNQFLENQKTYKGLLNTINKCQLYQRD